MSDQTTYKRQVTRREVTPKGDSSSADRGQNQRSDQRADQSAGQRSSSNRRRNRRSGSSNRRQKTSSQQRPSSDRSDRKDDNKKEEQDRRTTSRRRRSSGRKGSSQRRQTRQTDDKRDQTQRKKTNEDKRERPVSDMPQQEFSSEQLKDAPREYDRQTSRDVPARLSDTIGKDESSPSKVRTRSFGEKSARSGRTTPQPRIKRFSEEETADDIARDNERIERKIELQIEEIGRISLDL